MYNESSWGVGLVTGMAAILFGIAAVFWPQITILTLLYLFAAYILVLGISDLFGGIFNIGSGQVHWLMKILLGVAETAVGIYLLRHPAVTFTTFILLIGFSLIIRGVFEIVGAFTDRLMMTHRTLMVIGGVLSTVIGIVILFQPVKGGVAFVWLLGIYALIIGPITISLALDARNIEKVVTGGRSGRR